MEKLNKETSLSKKKYKDAYSLDPNNWFLQKTECNRLCKSAAVWCLRATPESREILADRLLCERHYEKKIGRVVAN